MSVVRFRSVVFDLDEFRYAEAQRDPTSFHGQIVVIHLSNGGLQLHTGNIDAADEILGELRDLVAKHRAAHPKQP